MTLPDVPRDDVTLLARRWSAGDESAFDALIELVYEDLRWIAHRHVQAGGDGATLDTTALVHEAYVRLSGAQGEHWMGRAKFFAFCSKAMRRILIDYARERSAAKRGGRRAQVPLMDGMAVVEEQVTQVLAIDEALRFLEERDERMARIAECRFFGGLSVGETAEVLDISERTVEREWAKARGYLHHLLADAGDGEASP